MNVGRVMMTADAVGGVWTYALELSAALGRAGVEVLLVVLGPPPGADQRRGAAALPRLRLETIPGRLEWMAGAEADLAATGAALLDLERTFRPDIVHLNGYAHAVLPWRAPRLVAAHSCVWSWWRAVHGEPPPDSWRGYVARVRAGLDAADMIVAPSRAFLMEMQALYRPLPAAAVVYNGRDPAIFAPAPQKEPFVLGVGRLWDEAKNLAALAEAARGLDWPVRFAGPLAGPDGLSRDCGAALPLGVLDPSDMAEWLGRAAIFAAPVRYEPFGLAALEAAFSGCALVLGDIPTQREIWGDAAVFVDPTDAGALRAALADLIAHENRREAMALRARRRAWDFTAEAMAQRYHAIYALTVCHKPAPSR